MRADTAGTNMSCAVLLFHPMIISHHQLTNRNHKDPTGSESIRLINETVNNDLEGVSVMMNLSFSSDQKQIVGAAPTLQCIVQ